jgi:hypothetical protein
VLPTEHGGWAFLFEPIVLGLLVAFSWDGVLVALAAVATYLARQPLKLFASDRQRGKVYPRTLLAERAFAALALLGAAALAMAASRTRGAIWPALAVAAPLAALALWFDLGRRSREAGAELSGALALGAIATAIALAGRWEPTNAFGLWAVLAARSVPTILYVRARLRLEKGQGARAGLAYVAHGTAIAWTAALATLSLAPWLSTAAMALLAARCGIGLSPWRPRMKTWQIGVSEIVFGLIVVACVVIGWRSEQGVEP